MAIQRLSDQLVSQIAAGEVVERPASVVKELVENALDAGATNIHVLATGGGRGLIRVSDDGIGINADEVELAFARHATSKLSSVEDLEKIVTLGFRGEALSSLAAVSQMSMTTRHRDDQMGTRIRVHGGHVLERRSVGAPAGTVVNVENLFFNVPARLKFLKSETTEKRQIMALVSRYALAYPNVRFTLEQDGREQFRSVGNGVLGDVIVRALGAGTFRQMVAVEHDDVSTRGLRVWGYVSIPALHRADRTQIALFVNGRWVQDSKLTYAVVQAYHGLIESGRFPLAVLLIEIEPQEVDVNVHPTKAEVRFRDPSSVFALVQRAIRGAIMATGERPAFLSASKRIETRFDRVWGERDLNQQELALEVDEDGLVRQERDDANPLGPTMTLDAIPEGIGRPPKPRTLPVLRVVGQVGATYIVAEGPAGLYLIDQHAAHHRVLLDQVEDLLNAEEPLSVWMLPSAQSVTLDQAAYDAYQQYQTTLQRLGFQVEAFGPDTLLLRAVPDFLNRTDPVSVFIDTCRALLDQAPPAGSVYQIAAVVTEFGAVRSGHVLGMDRMQNIVRALERVRTPLVCPNGKPTFIHLTGEQLARQFGR